MKKIITLCLLIIASISCKESSKSTIISIVGEEEYTRLMNLDLDGFDQSSEGFRQYTGNYDLTCLLIPEYISVNKLPDEQSRNLHWHLGQIHAFNENIDDAIKEMKQAFTGGSVTWECYVTGSIAFLERDKATLEDSLARLRLQDNWMNIEILEKFVKYFDSSYAEAYSAAY